MKAYFYIDSNNVQKGPVAGERLTEFGATAETPVWCDGMSDWMPAETVDELKPLFQQPPWQQFGQQQYAGSQSYQQQPNYGSYQQPYNQSRQYGYNPQQPVPEKPDNWLAWSIVCTSLLVLFTAYSCIGIILIPISAIGIVYASKVDSLWKQGQYDEAISSAKKAKTFTIIAASGFIAIILLIILLAILGITMLFANSQMY